MNYKIGYIDEDIDQVKKITRILRDHGFDVVGYEINQGMPIDELIEQVYQSDIDLLMIDYLLKTRGTLTFNGDEIERRYKEIKPKFPHIIFTSHEGDAFDHVDDPNIIYEKRMVDEDNISRFVEILKRNIESYHKYIGKRKVEIQSLVEKGEKEGLTEMEENQLLQSQIELKGLDKKSGIEVPLQLFSSEKLRDLSKTRKEAEYFLQSLMDKKRNNEG